MHQRSKVKKPSMFAQSKNPQLLQKQKSDEFKEEEQKQLQFPLFSVYSKLMSIPKVDLIKEHTRIRLIPNFGQKFGFKELYIKRDDMINDTYGGNKVRKFEFLLGYALSRKVKTIIGLGGIGSNCCVCMAALSRKYGIKPKLYLGEQPLTEEVQQNLKLMGHFGAQMKLISKEELMKLHFQSMEQDFTQQTDIIEWQIPGGGSNILGTIGFINAAFEVKMQIDCNDAKVPNMIFVPCGSLGTTAGLLLGFALLGFTDTIIYAVEVSGDNPDKRPKIIKLALDTLKYLQFFDASIPDISEEYLHSKFVLISNFYGTGYGVPTKESEEAKKLMKEMDFIQLDSSYTGKAFAAMKYLLENQRELFNDKVVLFWNTKNSIDYQEQIQEVEYKQDLPEEFHKFLDGSIPLVTELVPSMPDSTIKFT